MALSAYHGPILVLTILVSTPAICGRVGRQIIDTRQIIDIVCSACDRARLVEKPPPLCCRCIDDAATCNNDIASGGSGMVDTGLNCPDSIDCQLFGNCDTPGCDVQGINILQDNSVEFDVRQGGEIEDVCPRGQKVCCNPVDSDAVVTRLGLVTANNPLGESLSRGDTNPVCEDSKLSALQDFGHGVTCGKRDSRVYYNADLAESFTNPGEWPWAVLIFKDGEYIGAGALMDNDVVVTVGHKVKNFVDNPSGLTVRLGDWNPNRRDPKEEHPYIEHPVKCVRIHPNADLTGTLENNVAVLKLNSRSRRQTETEEEKAVASVIDLKSAPLRPADVPEGIEGSSKIKRDSFLDLRIGLVALDDGIDPLGSPEISRPIRQAELSPSYINTVCLPRNERQFINHDEHCWVAAWGKDLHRQREIDLPLVTKSDCERRLGPIFRERGIPNWRPKPSEVCAGGVRGKDTCDGEGGAPLVCYDKGSDQYFALGLVSYGFGCNNTRPAVYTNLADPSVKDFITSSFGNNFFC